MKNKSGFSTIELLVAITVFTLFSASTAALIFSGEDLLKVSLDSFKALLYAQEGLEATRAIRDESWENLSQGDHGLTRDGGSWSFSGESEVLEEKYRRKITLVSINQDKFKAVSQASWFNKAGQEKKIELVTYLTNWQRVHEDQGSGGVDLGDSGRDVYVSGNYTYVAVDHQHKSLMGVDTTNPLNGQIVSTLDLHGKGKDVFVKDNYAYVPLDTNKVAIVNVSNPANPNKVASMNISSQPTSVFVLDGYAYIGQDKKNEGLVIYNVANPETPVFYRSYNIGLSVYDVKVKNGWIYMAVRAGRGFDINEEGTYAFVAVDAEGGGFEVYYLWPPLVFHQATLDVAGPGSNVFLDQDTAYVAVKNEEGGLVRVGVSSPTNPVFIDATDIGGEGNGVFYQNGYAYMAVENKDSGLVVVAID